MAALVCIAAGAALSTLGPRTGVALSSTLECLNAMPGGHELAVAATVSAGQMG